MGRYIVTAVILIEADTYKDFLFALEDNDWNDLEIIHITYPEDE